VVLWLHNTGLRIGHLHRVSWGASQETQACRWRVSGAKQKKLVERNSAAEKPVKTVPVLFLGSVASRKRGGFFLVTERNLQKPQVAAKFGTVFLSLEQSLLPLTLGVGRA